MLTGAQWARLEPLIETCRPKGRTNWWREAAWIRGRPGTRGSGWVERRSDFCDAASLTVQREVLCGPSFLELA